MAIFYSVPLSVKCFYVSFLVSRRLVTSRSAPYPPMLHHYQPLSATRQASCTRPREFAFRHSEKAKQNLAYC